MPIIALYHPQRETKGHRRLTYGWTPRQVDLTWEALAERLSQHERTPCHPCPGKVCAHRLTDTWGPYQITNNFKNYKNVIALTALVFDFDHITNEQGNLIFEKACDSKLRFILVSTHSHKPESPSFRLVFDLDKPVPAAMWPAFWRTSIEILGFQGLVDTSCKDVSRAYLLPNGPNEPIFVSQPGDSISTDYILEQCAIRGFVFTNQRTDIKSSIQPKTSFDLSELRRLLRQSKNRKKNNGKDTGKSQAEDLEKILDGEPFCEVGSRSTRCNQIASQLAYCLPIDTPWEAAIELVRDSLNKTDCVTDTDPPGIDFYLDIVKQSFIKAQNRRAEEQEEARIVLQRVNAYLGGNLPNVKLIEDKQKVDHEGLIEEANIKSDDVLCDGWEQFLKRDVKGNLKNCGYNAYVILSFDPRFKGFIRYDSVNNQIKVTGGVFEDHTGEDLDTRITDWLEKYYDLNISIANAGARIAAVGLDNSFDPIKDYLNSVEWDGYDRIDNWLLRYTDPKTISDGRDITDHIQRISRRFLIGAAARGLSPGVKMDNILVLEGPQNIKKTMLCRVLGGDFYMAESDSIIDKDARARLASKLIVELGELRGLNMAGQNSSKNHLTLQEDYFRLPYTKTNKVFPRRSVYIGTVNPNDGSYGYKDYSGNRRYWPVYCTKIDIKALKQDRDQLWAEAVYCYNQYVALDKQGIEPDDNPFRWWLNSKEQSEADLETDQRMIEDPYEQLIGNWWFSMAPPRAEFLIATEVATKALRLPVERVDDSVVRRVSLTLQALGFMKSRPRQGSHGNRSTIYLPSDQLRDAPQKINRIQLGVSQGNVVQFKQKGK